MSTLPSMFTTDDLPGLTPEQRAAVSGIIRAVTKWHVAPSITQTLEVIATGDTSMDLPTMYATASVVRVDGIVSAYASVLPMGRLVFSAGHAPAAGTPVSVDLTHGYDTCPAGLISVARGVIARDNSAGNVVRAEGLGGWNTQYVAAAAAFTPLEAMMIAPHILPWLA